MQHQNKRGFGMIELLVVIAIIGILAAVAFPAYMDSVRKAHRKDAQISLTETAQRLERCYTEFNRYNHDDCPVTFPRTSAEGRYTITATALTASAFSLTAAPAPGNATQNDAQCTTFTLAHTGMKGATGEAPALCWQ